MEALVCGTGTCVTHVLTYSLKAILQTIHFKIVDSLAG